MSYRTPCCGYPTIGGDPDRSNVIKWNPYNEVVQCHNCGACYRMVASDQVVEGDEPFQLLRMAETLATLTAKLEAQFSTGACVNYLEACRDALDPHDEEEKRVLQGAIDVLIEEWPSDAKVGRMSQKSEAT